MKNTTSEFILCVFGGIAFGFLWHFGDESFVVGFIVLLLTYNKLLQDKK